MGLEFFILQSFRGGSGWTRIGEETDGEEAEDEKGAESGPGEPAVVKVVHDPYCSESQRKPDEEIIGSFTIMVLCR